jgi:L,D-peptidoglycan transpeptidase YkuD (ErfK/YbiS/YcfS/YnhG family)
LILTVDAAGWLALAGSRWRCALGKGGIVAAKREGDGGTPVGRFPLRGLLFRPDRLTPPPCALPTRALTPADGWCDDPGHADYNRAVRLPHPARCEQLWRQDGVYDLILPLGYNDDPPVPFLGSAIFLHVAREDYRPTEGCIALARQDLLTLLPLLAADASLDIAQPAH